MDRGIGFVAFAWRPDAAPVDSLAVFAGPAEGAPVARLLRSSPDGAFRLEAAPGVRANLVEFAYEEVGVPLDSLGDGWARVVYGATADGAPVRGWVRLVPERTVHHLWRDFLPLQAMLRAADGGALALFDRPDGAPLSAPAGDADVNPLRAEGDWLRVEVVSPPLCGGAEEPVARDTAWVRFLGPDGRPRVWFPSRGC